MFAEYYSLVPRSPDFVFDWQEFHRRFAWARALADCPQSPVYHAEGNVAVHTGLVCEWLVTAPAWRGLDERARRIVFWAALLHDIGKPATTRREDDGRITSRGHSRRGELMVRGLLWSWGVPFAEREMIAAIIRTHQLPFFLLERDDARRKLYEISQTVRCDYLSLVAEADARGRICRDLQSLLDNIELFREMARDEACLTGPRAFPSDHSRFLYFRAPHRNPTYHAYDDTVCEVVMLAGLPGAGKSTWAATQGGPQVCLDDVRRTLGISPAENQGPVMQEARERARVFLRRQQSFIWNATSLLRQHRQQNIDLFAAYRARVRIVYIEVPETRLFHQNADRAAVVPVEVIRKMIDKWEIPDVTEAHRVDYLITEDAA